MALLNMSASVELEYQKLQATTEEDKHAGRRDQAAPGTGRSRITPPVGDIQKLNILENLAEETRKVEEEESKVDLYSRMRQAVMSDKMNESNQKLILTNSWMMLITRNYCVKKNAPTAANLERKQGRSRPRPSASDSPR
jgi:hypothetical protein